MQFLVVLFLLLFPIRQQPATTYDVYYAIFSASDNATPITLQVLEQAQMELEPLHIYIRLLRTGQFAENSGGAVGIEVNDNFDSERLIVGYDVGIIPHMSPLQEVSPMLEDGLPVHISLSDPESANVIAAMIAYAANNCTLIDNLKSSHLDRLLDFYRANCAVMCHDFQQAEILYPNALQDPGGDYWLPTVTNLAWSYLQTGDDDKAFELINQVIQNQQLFGETADEIETYTLRSQLYALAFRYTDAIADMDSAIALDPSNPALYVERGQRIILTYDWDRALADYNHALQLDPNDADAYYYRGILYASVPEGIDARRSALADFQRYLDLAPDGQHAADAARYRTDIQDQLAALGANP